MPSPEFTDSIIASLEYWEARTRNMDDRVIGQIDVRRQNLFRSVRFGLTLKNAWPVAARVALQTIPLVNRRLYRAEWIPVLEQLLVRCPPNEVSVKFDLLIQLGRMQRLERRFADASRTLGRAEVLARELADASAMARAQYNLGRVCLDRRQYEESERHSTAALALLSDLQDADQTLLAWTLDSLGRINQARGDYAEAAQFLTRRLAIERAIGDPTGIARALNDLGNIQRLLEHLDEAVDSFLTAEQLLASTDNELDKTVIRLNLGATYFDRGEWTLAEQALKQAYSPYLRQSGNLLYQATVTVSLGNVLLKQERLIEAEAYLRLSIDLWRRVSDDLNLANAVGSLGEVLALKGETSEAIRLFDEALEVLSEYPDHPWAVGSLKIFEAERAKAMGLSEGDARASSAT
jgi:tetratricopeptide (TPR) repeat protein